MWWSRAFVCLMVLVAGPVGCGFQPMYAKPGDAPSSVLADKLSQVRVMGIEDRSGQQLRNLLVTSMNPTGEPGRPSHTLHVRLSEVIQSMATSKDGNATVGKLQLTATYELRDAQTNYIVFAGTARAISGYRYLGPRYASTVSERESRTSALTEVSAEIRSAVGAFFSSPMPAPRMMPLAPTANEADEQ